MAEQIVRIRKLAARTHVEVRILPWSAGAHPAMIGSFAIFDFEHEADPPVVYVELQTGAHYLEKPAEVLEHRRIFDLALQQTVPLRSGRASGTSSGARWIAFVPAGLDNSWWYAANTDNRRCRVVIDRYQ